MLTRINKAREDREGGFTLIELLVVVAIIAILAVIAIPIFNNFRDNAANSAVQAETKNAATLLETFYTQNGSYPASQTDFDSLNINVSEGTALTYTVDTTSDTYDLAGCSVSTGVQYNWASEDGTFGTDGTCTTTTGGTITDNVT
jgi:type IV pilus assembly protein PilA